MNKSYQVYFLQYFVMIFLYVLYNTDIINYCISCVIGSQILWDPKSSYLYTEPRSVAWPFKLLGRDAGVASDGDSS